MSCICKQEYIIEREREREYHTCSTSLQKVFYGVKIRDNSVIVVFLTSIYTESLGSVVHCKKRRVTLISYGYLSCT